MTDTSHERFNQALTSTSANPIAPAAFHALNSKLGAVRMGQLIAGVEGGDQAAVPTLHRFAAIAGFYGRLSELGISATIDQAREILQQHSLEDARSAVNSACSGDPNAKAVLRAWLQATVASSAHTGQMPAIPQRPTGQVARADAGAARAPVTPAPRQSMAPPPSRPTGQAERVQQPQQPPSAQVHDINQTRRTPEEYPEPRSFTPRTYDQAKAHGGKAALTFVADTTARDNPTVMIESATILNAAERTYDWNNKWRFQFTRHELQLVTALLFEMVPELHFSNHNEKWLTVTRQDSDPQYGGTIKFTMGLGKASQNQPRTVQVDSSTIGEITALCVRQCLALLKCDATTLAPVLRQVAKTYLTQQACRNARQQQRQSG